MSDYRKLTRADLIAEATERFGPDPMTWAFRCPTCHDVATAADFPAGRRERIGQECIGRHLGVLTKSAGPGGAKYAGRGCDWVAYGLFRGPWEIVMPDGRSAWSFALADSPVVNEPASDAVPRSVAPDAYTRTGVYLGERRDV